MAPTTMPAISPPSSISVVALPPLLFEMPWPVGAFSAEVVGSEGVAVGWTGCILGETVGEVDDGSGY
jgi:hypothetical protein